MQRKRPAFWQEKGLISLLLVPLSFFWDLIAKLRFLMAEPPEVSIPVLCLGNVVVGGAGKTPIAIAIAKHYIKREKRLAFVSRGYGGTISSDQVVVQVADGHYTAKEIGDEALLLAEIAPVYISTNRYHAALKAQREGAQLIIMDDGLQNYQVAKDISLLLIDNDYGLGNGLSIPAGPLREPIALALKKSDVVIYTGKGAAPNDGYHAELIITNAEEFNTEEHYVSLCSIASPSKFHQSLEVLNLTIDEHVIYGDHHLYTRHQLIDIVRNANERMIITTEKDHVKIPEDLRMYFTPLKIEYQLPDGLINLLDAKLFNVITSTVV